jgi:hypothetical protein
LRQLARAGQLAFNQILGHKIPIEPQIKSGKSVAGTPSRAQAIRPAIAPLLLVYPFLKNCTARSCFFAAAIEENVPKFRRLPVLGFFLREYRRYSPDFSFRIMSTKMLFKRNGVGRQMVRVQIGVFRAKKDNRI